MVGAHAIHILICWVVCNLDSYRYMFDTYYNFCKTTTNVCFDTLCLEIAICCCVRVNFETKLISCNVSSLHRVQHFRSWLITSDGSLTYVFWTCWVCCFILIILTNDNLQVRNLLNQQLFLVFSHLFYFKVMFAYSFLHVFFELCFWYDVKSNCILTSVITIFA